MLSFAQTVLGLLKSVALWLLADPRRITTAIVMAVLITTLVTSFVLTGGPVFASPMATSGGP